MIHHADNPAPPSEDFQRGCVAALTLACVTLANFRSGDGPSCVAAPQHISDAIALATNIVGGLMNKPEELAALEHHPVSFPKEAHRHFDLLQTLPWEERLAYETKRQRVEQAQRTRVQAMLDSLCPAPPLAEELVEHAPVAAPSNVVTFRSRAARSAHVMVRAA